MDIFSTWEFNLIMYYIFTVLYFQFYKLAVNNANDDGSATIILQSIAGISILTLTPLFMVKFPDSFTTISLLAGASIFYAINDRLQTTLRKHLEVSEFSVLGQLGVIFLIIYSFTVFSEPISINKIIGAGLILGANLIIFYKPGHSKKMLNVPKKYLIIGIIAQAAFATAISIDIGISDEFNLPIYISLTLLLPGIMVALAEKIKIKTLKKEWLHGTPKLYIITSVAWSLTILFSLRSYQFGEVSTIVPLQAAAVLLNVLVAFFIHEEKENRSRKVLAALIVIIGVYLTVI